MTKCHFLLFWHTIQYGGVLGSDVISACFSVLIFYLNQVLWTSSCCFALGISFGFSSKFSSIVCSLQAWVHHKCAFHEQNLFILSSLKMVMNGIMGNVSLCLQVVKSVVHLRYTLSDTECMLYMNKLYMNSDLLGKACASDDLFQL